MAHIIRDTALGQILRLATGRKVLQYPEEKEDFSLPDSWIEAIQNPSGTTTTDEAVIARDGYSEKDNPSMPEPIVSREGGLPLTIINSQVIEGVPPRQRPESPVHETHHHQHHHNNNNNGNGNDNNNNATVEKVKTKEPSPVSPSPSPSSSSSSSIDGDVEEAPAAASPFAGPPLVPTKTKDSTSLLITWYSPTDSSNPQNWSSSRKAFVTFLIALYTFVVYTSSAIYTPSMEEFMSVYDVDVTVASLGLALYVLGYGTGPLLFSPLGEVARIGRNPVYIVTMVLFLIISIPTAFVDNVPGFMVLRFLQGFFGSPCLATGAATLADMYDFLTLPYALIAWVSSAYCGPALGPLLAGYSVPAMGWRWSLYEIIWAATPIVFLMVIFLPETLADNILYRRARRLRVLQEKARSQSSSSSPNTATIGADNGSDASPSTTTSLATALTFRAPSEISHAPLTTLLLEALTKPLEITLKDPAILFVQLYTALIYGIYYSFFEVFPLVYPTLYHMSPGEVGLVFLCILISCLVGAASYALYLYRSVNPVVERILAAGSGRLPQNESRLAPALFASFGPTVGLFVFAWTSTRTPQVHWAVPTLGIVVYGATSFVVMQCIFVYVPMSYPRYAASLFAGNDFFRSALAFASILFAKPLFENLGVARGTSLLGGLSTMGILGIFLLWKYGRKLRSMSKFAIADE
ncbi:hypothetical protein MKZ38_003208 [Zalerion maritima]|uniref:Major facilitator superfamily (MFS) profile domain-containing protein n=1 Tax=Zalerion maritima TaxID=339359 RepID=A0AAD5WYV2_9PEZI|nr:hypothetical protein MKZ38_003208 [Zalerion maritima]